jgi:hypothetical protein
MISHIPRRTPTHPLDGIAAGKHAQTGIVVAGTQVHLAAGSVISPVKPKETPEGWIGQL